MVRRFMAVRSGRRKDAAIPIGPTTTKDKAFDIARDYAAFHETAGVAVVRLELIKTVQKKGGACSGSV
jgi:hypothetical protein